MKHKVKGGSYLPSWMDQQAKGRADVRRARPKRDTLLVREGVRNMKLKFKCEVSFWNPTHTGKQGNLDGGLQWIDIVAWYRDVDRKLRPLYILIDYKNKRFKDYERVAWEAKQKYLKSRGDVLVLPEKHGSQEYWILINREVKKLNQDRTIKELGY